MRPERKVRRSQAISPFGVGAIMDILGESFVAEDVSRWRGRHETLDAPRIAAHFEVSRLRTPPSTDDAALPYFRFPQWLFCGRCRRMTRWSPRRERPGQTPRCEVCAARPQLVPMRFVTVCGNGHLADVNWPRWAHSRPAGRDQRQCGATEDLEFRHVEGVGGGLESVQVRCRTCNAARDLRDLVAPEALKQIAVTCPGRQPWQYDSDAVTCDQTPVVLQRGASSVYFPEVVSAIDLPPDSDWSNWGSSEAGIRHNGNFRLLLTNPDHPLRDQLIGIIAAEADADEAQVRLLLTQELGQPPPSSRDAATDLTLQEWHALTNPREDHDPRDRFVARRTPFPSPEGHGSLQGIADRLSHHIADVVLVDRLREIRVLKGFRRHTMDRLVPADLTGRTDQLPAIEVFGEGVFIRLDEDRVAQWSNRGGVQRRCESLRKNLARSFRATWLPDVSPRLVLLHTLAHLLIRQMSFVAGYSSSSLRERLFNAEAGTGTSAMAGVLVYTAAGDSEGTLGGLVRLGRADRLVPVFASALDNARWCSFDPVCRESTAQGPDSLSLAACHACALTSETSCVMSNLLLDRMLLVDEDLGFFRDIPGLLAGGAG